jgi:hypothetical protein
LLGKASNKSESIANAINAEIERIYGDPSGNNKVRFDVSGSKITVHLIDQAVDEYYEEDTYADAGDGINWDEAEEKEDINSGSSVSSDKSLESAVSQRLLSEADLSGISKADLRILRNVPYAKHGRKFTTKDLQDYFGAKSWYKPQYDNVDNKLSDIEKKNIAFIQKHE